MSEFSYQLDGTAAMLEQPNRQTQGSPRLPRRRPRASRRHALANGLRSLASRIDS